MKLDFQKLSSKCYATGHEKLIGVHGDIQNDDYHSGPGISKSSLDMVERSINHFLNSDKVRKETPAMLLGTCVHAALLEPKLWATGFEKGPDMDQRTKEWKQAEAQAKLERRVLVPPEIYDAVQAIVDGVMAHPVARELLESNANIEHSFYCADPKTNMLLKARPDIWIPGASLLIDLKTTKCAALDGQNSFARSSGMFNYDKQVAFYSDVVRSVTNRHHDFLFIAVENEAPYNCAVFEMSREDVDNGRNQYTRDLTKLDEFLRAADTTAYPPGYGFSVETINIPRYMRRTNG